jgi:hypothetical protein
MSFHVSQEHWPGRSNFYVVLKTLTQFHMRKK